MSNGTSGSVTVLLRLPVYITRTPRVVARPSRMPDTAESREWMRGYARDVLRERFRQKAIYLKFVGPVEHLIVSEEEIGHED